MHQSQAHRNPGKGERTTKGTMRITTSHKKLSKACSFVACRLGKILGRRHSPPRRGGVDAPTASGLAAQTGWSDRQNVSAELQLRLRPAGLALRATSTPPLRGGEYCKAPSRLLNTAIRCAALSLALVLPLEAAEHRVVGLTSSRMRIEAALVSSPSFTVPTVMLVGGLGGNDESARLVEQEVRRWGALSQGRRFQLIAIALANPGAERLQFPPTGVAYRENAVSHVLWRWIGIHAPDLVIVAGNEDSGLADALSRNSVAGVGRIPARRVDVKEGILQSLPRDIPPSEAHRELDRRLRRTARELAAELAEVYGHDFDQPIYMPGMAVIGQLRLGRIAEGERLAAPYTNGAKNPLQG